MPIEKSEIEEQGSPAWWLHRLSIALHNRRSGVDGRRKFTRTDVESSRVRPGLTLLADYLRGDPPLRQDIHGAWAAPFRQFLRMGRMNVAPLLVSAPSNRMGIRDFRTAAAGDELGDSQARLLMRRNKLRVKVRQVHDAFLGLGDGYTIVTPPDRTRPWSLITAESPLHCITAEDPMTGQTIAGLKMFRDDWDAADWAYLFLPGELYVARADVPASTLFHRHFELTKQWSWDYDRFDSVPGNEIAMGRLQNKDGVSEIEGHLDALDRINDKIFNEWYIGKVQAFKQRAIKLADVDDENGSDDEDEDDLTAEELSSILVSGPDSMWQLPAGAEIWESGTVDTRMMVDSIKAELQWLAAMSFNPLQSITPDASQGSAEGATLQREEHVYKIEDRRDRAGDFWSEQIAKSFRFQGDTTRAEVEQIDTIWGPIERYGLAEKSAAANQLKGILPLEAILTDVLQYETADVQGRLRSLRSQDLLYGDGTSSPTGFGGNNPPAGADQDPTTEPGEPGRDQPTDS